MRIKKNLLSLSRPLSVSLLTGFLLSAGTARASDFDDAVNLYLKGFDACQTANKALGSNDLETARKKIAEYDKIFNDAKAINASIANTKERNMEGNILVCKRITTEIQNKAGQPAMDQALAACKSAEDSIEGGDPSAASGKLDQFRSLRDQALGLSPGLKDIFSVSSALSRCERLENKIGRVAAKQEAEDAKVDAVVSAAKNYADACNAAVAALGTGRADDNALRNANAKIASAQGFRKNAAPGGDVKKIFAARPDHPGLASIETSVKTGDACMASVQKQVASKSAELANIKKAAAQFDQQADKLVDLCNDALRIAGGEPKDDALTSARKKAEEASTQGKALVARLNADNDFSAARDAGLGGDTLKNADTASRCIASAEAPLKAMATAITQKKLEEKAKADAEAKRLAEEKAHADAEAKKKADEAAHLKAEAEAKKKAEEQAAAEAKAKKEAEAKAASDAAAVAAASASAEAPTPTAAPAPAPAESAHGVFAKLTLKGATPAWGVFYLLDGGKAPVSVEAELAGNGFKQPVYIVAPGGKIDIKNSDNGMHRIQAEDAASGTDSKLPMMQSRTKKPLEMNLELNHVIEVKSESARQTPALIAAVSGSRHVAVNVKSGSAEFRIPDSDAKKGVLLVPGFDPVEIDLAGGKATVNRKGSASGEIHIEKR